MIAMTKREKAPLGQCDSHDPTGTSDSGTNTLTVIRC